MYDAPSILPHTGNKDLDVMRAKIEESGKAGSQTRTLLA